MRPQRKAHNSYRRRNKQQWNAEWIKNWGNEHTREISSVSTNRRDAKFIYIKITSDEKSTMI